MTDCPAITPLTSIPGELRPTLNGLCGVAADLARVIASGTPARALDAAVGRNADGDSQKALDVIADEMFQEALARQDVRWYASEEQDDIVGLNPEGSLALAIDPLDGSSNIDTNVSIGSIFPIYRARDEAESSILRPGR